MPEGPEIHMSSLMVTKLGDRITFKGRVIKSSVSVKNPEVDWKSTKYTISATSRGKEMKLFLTDVGKSEKKSISILFHFGMSGKFQLTNVEDLPKHAHLQFYSSDGTQVLSFVDYRRFGRWFVNQDWGTDRGPCFLTEYYLFRNHIYESLNKRVFDAPICEVLLNQKYFNGVGNYLRAEALYRCGVKPFDPARKILELLFQNEEIKSEALLVKKEVIHEEKYAVMDEKVKDIIFILNKLGNEVVAMGCDGYESSSKRDNGTMSEFDEWLQCYMQPGMENMKDGKKRTIWFHGPPGGEITEKAKEVLSSKSKKSGKIAKTRPDVPKKKRKKEN